jgi:hypothetical protein
MRQGFYWPTAAEDAKELVRSCKNCQMLAKRQKAPTNLTSSIFPTWPLQRWGVHIVGPLPTVLENLCFAAVTLEYFSKWIEAKALAKITSDTLISFICQRIICCFGVPSYITVDNGKQFDCTDFRNLCSKLGIKIAFASVNHPESNGAVERANDLIFSLVSKALFDLPKRKWLQEMITTVWGHNTLRTRNNRVHPLSLAIWQRSHHARRTQAWIFPHTNSNNNSHSAMCGA